MFYIIPLNYIFAALKLATHLLIWGAINFAIELFWAGMELYRYGVTKPSYEDAIIGIILTFSLYSNIVNTYEFRYKWLEFEKWILSKYREGFDNEIKRRRDRQ